MRNKTWIIRIILVIIILLSISTLMLTGCNKTPQQNYTKIELSLDNYSDYIGFNFYFTDHQAIPLDDGNYTIYCTGHFETIKKTDCNFENAKISYASPKFTGCYTNPSGLATEISYEGNSHTSFYIVDEISSMILYPSAHLNYINVTNISGYVIIPN